MNSLENNYWTFTGNGETWKSLFSPWPKTHKSFYQESIRTAEKITDERIGDILVMYSGGIDSEYVLNVFRDINAPVTPVLIRLSSGLNYHDFRYAVEYCDRNCITPIIIDIDFEEFLESGKMLDITKEMKTHVYHYAALAQACSQVEGTIVIGSGEPDIRLIPETNSWNVVLHEYDFALGKYFKNHGIHGTPYFPIYTPEMMMAFLDHPIMKELAENKHPGKLSSVSSRYIIYTDESKYDIVRRPKYTGYEIIELQKIFKHTTFLEIAKLKQKHSGIYSEDYFNFITQWTVNNC
jgi:hypothetical protein